MLRLLKIKTGVLRRNLKDLHFAETNVAREVGRLRTYEEAADDDKMHQQKKVIQEHEATIPMSRTRIQTAAADLSEFLAANEEALPPADDADRQAAAAVLAEAAKLDEGDAAAGGDGGYDDDDLDGEEAAPAAAAA